MTNQYTLEDFIKAVPTELTIPVPDSLQEGEICDHINTLFHQLTYALEGAIPADVLEQLKDDRGLTSIFLAVSSVSEYLQDFVEDYGVNTADAASDYGRKSALLNIAKALSDDEMLDYTVTIKENK